MVNRNDCFFLACIFSLPPLGSCTFSDLYWPKTESITCGLILKSLPNSTLHILHDIIIIIYVFTHYLGLLDAWKLTYYQNIHLSANILSIKMLIFVTLIISQPTNACINVTLWGSNVSPWLPVGDMMDASITMAPCRGRWMMHVSLWQGEEREKCLKLSVRSRGSSHSCHCL